MHLVIVGVSNKKRLDLQIASFSTRIIGCVAKTLGELLAVNYEAQPQTVVQSHVSSCGACRSKQSCQRCIQGTGFLAYALRQFLQQNRLYPGRTLLSKNVNI